MDIHIIRKIYSIIVVTGCILVAVAPVLGMIINKSLYWILICIGVVFALIGLVYGFKMYRCPSCGEILPMREPMPDSCPRCGRRF